MSTAKSRSRSATSFVRPNKSFNKTSPLLKCGQQIRDLHGLASHPHVDVDGSSGHTPIGESNGAPERVGKAGSLERIGYELGGPKDIDFADQRSNRAGSRYARMRSRSGWFSRI